MNIKIILFAACLLFVMGCEKDTNEYNHELAENITVAGLESEYTLLSEYDVLKIDVSANTTYPVSDFDFSWGVYETNVSGAIPPKLDTIGQGPKLVYPVKLRAKTWMLVLIVKNRVSGLTKYVATPLHIITKFTRGWYIAKTEGDSTDLDLHLTPEKIDVTTLEANVFSFLNGHKLYGQAKRLNFQSRYKSDITGILANTRTLFVQTDQSIRPLNINTLKEIHDDGSIFLGGTPIGGVGALFTASVSSYLIRGGQLYTLYHNGANSGKFGAAIMMDKQNTPYQLSDYFVASTTEVPILWDRLSGSFVTAEGYGTYMTQFKDDTNNKDIKVRNNNKSLLYMGYKDRIYDQARWTTDQVGYAILQDKGDLSLRSLVKLFDKDRTLTITPITIPTNSLLYDATMYALNQEDESILYFLKDNNIYSHNLDNGYEQLQFSVPQGEQVTQIKHLKYEEGTAYTFNYIIIATQKAGKYVIRFFNKLSGNLESTPVFTLRGEGVAKDILYISPNVYDSTYPDSY